MSEHRHFLLGLFFLIVFGGIGYYTLSHSDLSLFKYSKTLSVYFPRGHGIQPGSSVEVAGVRWGKVTDVQFDPDAQTARRVIVTMDLDKPLTLHENQEILIKTATLLGGRVLAIDPGTVDHPVLGDDVVLFGAVAADPIEAIGELVRGNEGALTEALDGIRDLIVGLKAGDGVLGRLFVNEELALDVSRGVKAAANTFESADVVAAAIARGEGTIGQLLMNDALYLELEEVGRNLRSITEDTRVIVADTRMGKGLVGRILVDDALGEDVSEALDDLREIIGRIERGEGTLGRIVSADGIGANVDELLQRLVDGKGSLGRLFTDDQLYADLSTISNDLAAITSKVREGRGTVGRLVMDEELYDQLRLAVGLVTRSLEEFREAAPISSITSVFFGAF